MIQEKPGESRVFYFVEALRMFGGVRYIAGEIAYETVSRSDERHPRKREPQK